MATYSIGDLSRREILEESLRAWRHSVVQQVFALARRALQRTPGHIHLFPFYLNNRGSETVFLWGPKTCHLLRVACPPARVRCGGILTSWDRTQFEGAGTPFGRTQG